MLSTLLLLTVAIYIVLFYEFDGTSCSTGTGATRRFVRKQHCVGILDALRLPSYDDLRHACVAAKDWSGPRGLDMKQRVYKYTRYAGRFL